jgi:hypothetical protein
LKKLLLQADELSRILFAMIKNLSSWFLIRCILGLSKYTKYRHE